MYIFVFSLLVLPWSPVRHIIKTSSFIDFFFISHVWLPSMDKGSSFLIISYCRLPVIKLYPPLTVKYFFAFMEILLVFSFNSFWSLFRLIVITRALLCKNLKVKLYSSSASSGECVIRLVYLCCHHILLSFFVFSIHSTKVLDYLADCVKVSVCKNLYFPFFFFAVVLVQTRLRCTLWRLKKYQS